MIRRDPTLAELLADVWAARLFLLAGGLIGLVGAGCFLAAAIPQYRAAMLIAPAERGAGPDIKALLPDNSSFAVQYMLNTLGSADSNDFIRFENILREPSVAGRLLADKTVTEGVRDFRRFTFGSKSALPDTAEELAAHFQDRIHIDPVGTTPLRRVVYQHPDPAFAKYLLTRLYQETDQIIKEDIKGKTENRTAYLQSALDTVTHPDHRRALTSLLMEQEHIRMILAMDEPFSAIMAEPAAAGVRPDWPKPALIVPAFVLASLVLAFVLHAIRRGMTP